MLTSSARNRGPTQDIGISDGKHGNQTQLDGLTPVRPETPRYGAEPDEQLNARGRAMAAGPPPCEPARLDPFHRSMFIRAVMLLPGSGCAEHNHRGGQQDQR